MKKIALYQVDVCAERLFSGNPAAVCPLDEWLPDAMMQAIAAENNLSETAFFVKDETGTADYFLRWFTPTLEIELCGHATLASGHVLWKELGLQREQIRFRTREAGILTVRNDSGSLWLSLPSRAPAPAAKIPTGLSRSLGAEPVQIFESGNKFMLVYAHADEVNQLRPDFAQLKQLTESGVIVTAPGRTDDEDFVSRFFAPAFGIDEDPVTGSAHCLLVPYWAEQLDKTELQASQLSARGGKIQCRLDEDSVWLSGKILTYLKGEIYLPA